MADVDQREATSVTLYGLIFIASNEDGDGNVYARRSGTIAPEASPRYPIVVFAVGLALNVVTSKRTGRDGEAPSPASPRAISNVTSTGESEVLAILM